MLAHSQVRRAVYGQGPALGLTSGWAQAGKGGCSRGRYLSPARFLRSHSQTGGPDSCDLGQGLRFGLGVWGSGWQFLCFSLWVCVPGLPALTSCPRRGWDSVSDLAWQSRGALLSVCVCGVCGVGSLHFLCAAGIARTPGSKHRPGAQDLVARAPGQPVAELGNDCAWALGVREASWLDHAGDHKTAGP